MVAANWKQAGRIEDNKAGVGPHLEAIPSLKPSSAHTGRALAAQERTAASATIAARAGGCWLLAAAHRGLLEARRVEHRDALRVEAGRAMRAGRPALERATGGAR